MSGDPETSIEDMLGAGAAFLSAEDYNFVQARVPIACVDLLPLGAGRPPAIGLIRRRAPAGQAGWCLVGGRVLHNEPLVDAVVRHVMATLGRQMSVDLGSLTLRTVAEYFVDPRPGALHDPRKHAIALTYTAICTGDPDPRGEALEFAWFNRPALDDLTFGFGQGRVVRNILVAGEPGQSATRGNGNCRGTDPLGD